MHIQRLPMSTLNLIVGGKGYNFDSSGLFTREVDFKFTNLEPVDAESYIVSGQNAEKAYLGQGGKVLRTEEKTVSDVIDEIARNKSKQECLGVLIKPIRNETQTTTQYIVLYRK